MLWEFSEGDKVKLNTEKILNTKIIKRRKYINFVKKNKDNIFTLKKIGNIDKHLVYTFKELEGKNNIDWHFNVSELILIEKAEVQ